MRAPGRLALLLLTGLWYVAGAVSPLRADERPVVVLDPGHTPETIGAVSADGELAEHALTLALAQKLAVLLEERGFTVHLTRRADGNLALPVRDEDGNGVIDDWEHLQPRTDLANMVGARILVSLHFNGSPQPEQSGTSVYYTTEGSYVAQGRRLATLFQRHLLAGLRAAGYHTIDLGALSDAGLKEYGTLYSLGQNPHFARLGRWPAVVLEPLFLTNRNDAAFLRNPAALDALAHSCARAIGEYFSGGRNQRVWQAH